MLVLLQKKQTEEDSRMKIMVDMLKNKGNKKAHFRLMGQVDHEKLVKSTVE